MTAFLIEFSLLLDVSFDSTLDIEPGKDMFCFIMLVTTHFLCFPLLDITV